jgi:hypothetical protein
MIALEDGNAGRLLLCAIALAACDTGRDTPASVVADAELIDLQSVVISSTTVMAIEGTYGASCIARTGAWAIALNGYKFTSGETQLSVVMNDPTCTLSVTLIKAGTPSATVSYSPVVPFLLAATFAANGVALRLNGAGGTQFYANFHVQPDLSFNTDFIVQMAYSDDINATSLTVVTSYAVSVASASALVIPAPNESVSLSKVDVRVTPFGNVVWFTNGGVVLTQGSVPGVRYVIDLDTLGSPPTFASIDASFNDTTKSHVALTGTSQTVAARDLGLMGISLTSPKTRNIIVINSGSPATTYQLIQLTFTHP